MHILSHMATTQFLQMKVGRNFWLLHSTLKIAMKVFIYVASTCLGLSRPSFHDHTMTIPVYDKDRWIAKELETGWRFVHGTSSVLWSAIKHNPCIHKHGVLKFSKKERIRSQITQCVCTSRAIPGYAHGELHAAIAASVNLVNLCTILHLTSPLQNTFGSQLHAATSYATYTMQIRQRVKRHCLAKEIQTTEAREPS